MRVAAPPTTFRPDYPIETERLLLRPYTADDLDALHEIERLESTARYLYNEPLSIDEVRALLERRQRMTSVDETSDGIVVAAEVRSEPGRAIGHFTLELRSREHRQGEIGYVLHPQYHGHGYATEGAAAMLHLGFERIGLHRIVGRLDGRNVASARVLERLGMRREAHLRENEFVKGEWVDEVVYAILDREWRASRGRAG